MRGLKTAAGFLRTPLNVSAKNLWPSVPVPPAKTVWKNRWQALI